MPSVKTVRVLQFVSQLVSAAVFGLALTVTSAHATSRIKDLANIEGVRQNQLIGYGLVVGLNGSGDTPNHIPFPKQSPPAIPHPLGPHIPPPPLPPPHVSPLL